MFLKSFLTAFTACSAFSIVSSQTVNQLTPITNVELRDNITLECSINGQSLTGRFVWFHEDELAYFGASDSIFNRRYRVAVTPQTSRLTITNVHFEDRGRWECEVAIGEMKQSTMTQLVIKSPPQWYNVTQQKDITLQLGGSAELYCDAIGDPTPVVTWTGTTGAGGIVLPDGKVTEYYIGSMLKLGNVTGMHNGKYKCHASNGHKQSIYEEFTVRVPSAPIVTVHTSTVRAPRNHTFHIGCMASSHPQITSLGSVSWFKGSRRIQNNADDYRYSISDSNDGLTSISILNTPRVNSTVAGTYRCEFSNNQGSASQTIRLDVGAASKPDVGASLSGAPPLFAVLQSLLTSVLFAVVAMKL
ncbi:opioid-binding protein/cell adhesion molecule homolog [Apostichopus japonicus]|uniref:opioid-binding protein/cell adhesion molecule homolog n=1 Tax=Stichopus japonicus TaxID=307972 RepID=UPI003AB415AC